MDENTGDFFYLSAVRSVNSGAADTMLGWRKGTKAAVFGSSLIITSFFIAPPVLLALVNLLSFKSYFILSIGTAFIGTLLYMNERISPMLHKKLLWLLHGGVYWMDSVLKWVDSGSKSALKDK